MQNNSYVDFINMIFDSFNKAKLEYCVLRNYEKLPYNFGNDLDILISEPHKKIAYSILQDISIKLNIKLIKKVDRYGHLGLYYLVNGTILPIDLLSKSLKQCFEYADSNFILQTKIRYNNFFIPQRGSIIFTVYLKDMLTYGYKRNKNVLLFNSLQESDKTSFINTGQIFFSKEVINLIYESCKGNKVISRQFLYFHLLKECSFINVFKFVLYRILDFFSYNFYWRWYGRNYF